MQKENHGLMLLLLYVIHFMDFSSDTIFLMAFSYPSMKLVSVSV